MAALDWPTHGAKSSLLVPDPLDGVLNDRRADRPLTTE